MVYGCVFVSGGQHVVSYIATCCIQAKRSNTAICARGGVTALLFVLDCYPNVCVSIHHVHLLPNGIRRNR